jgi:Zinc carboxypeptidase
LDWSAEEERYWFLNARDGLERFRRLAEAHRAECELSEIARSARGLPVYALRLGSGPRRVALLSGMHGCEPSGPRGLLAYLDSLLNRTAPFGTASDPAILKAATLCAIPLLNPGGAQRFSVHFPDSWHGTWLKGWTEANQQRFFAEGNEPLHFFYGTWVKKPPMRFTPEQIAEWEATGHVLGSSLTDGGLDMWFDWDETHGAETEAVKDLLHKFRPDVIADFHNFMFPTEVFAPTVYSPGALAEKERSLAVAAQEAWRTRRLPFHDRPPRPYPKPAEKYYEDYWFHQLGAATLIFEINGGLLATEGTEYEATRGERPLTRRESLESAWGAVEALVRRAAS